MSRIDKEISSDQLATMSRGKLDFKMDQRDVAIKILKNPVPPGGSHFGPIQVPQHCARSSDVGDPVIIDLQYLL